MNIKIISAVFGILVLGILAYTFIYPPVPTRSEQKVEVVASFYPLYFFASEIGGDKAQVMNITPAGAEPHDYEPTAQDIAHIEKAQLLVLNGGGLEVWGDNVQQNINHTKTVVVVAGEGLTTQKVEEEGEVITDPHIWLSPQLAEQMVDKIEAAFVKVDPKNVAYYSANADVLNSKLQQLDTQYKQELSSCTKKDIITSHAAFGYLATSYGLRQVAITGISPDSEPSAQQLAEVAKFARDHKVQYIFFESLISPKLSQTIATEVGAQTLVLNPIEGLNDEEIVAHKNYLTEMQQNLTNLKIALQCQTSQ